MDWSRVGSYVTAAQDRLREAYAVDHPPRLVAASFALGLFIIALPNLGLGLVVVAAIASRFDWANPPALSAAAVVLNPVVKSGVYVASFALGTVLLGPVPGIFSGRLTLSAGPGVLSRLLVGNLIVAAGVAVGGYLVSLYGVAAVR